MRIVSLLPSATEIVCVLGLEDQLVGVTHECDFPASVTRLPKVTQALIPADATSGEIDRLVRERMSSDLALYSLNLPMLQELQPDLIVTQALCDVCAVAEEEVRAAAYMLPGNPRVINLEPESLTEVFGAMAEVAAAVGMAVQGGEVVRGLKKRVDAIVTRSSSLARTPRVAMLEWLDPPFSSGHWTPELIRFAGGNEGLGREGERSRTLRWDEVIAWQPEFVFVACCGFGVERTLCDMPALKNVPGWNELPAVRSGRVYITDGSHYFSRPGPRLVDSLEILAHAMHPELHPLPRGLPPAVQYLA